MSETRKVIGRLNRYWAKQIQGLAMHYKHPFMDIEEISITTETGEISVIEKNIDGVILKNDSSGISDNVISLYNPNKK